MKVPGKTLKILLVIIFLSMVTWGVAKTESNNKEYSIKGDIPGLLDCSVIKLINCVSDKNEILGETHANQQKFVLNGCVGEPTVCMLKIYPDSTLKEYKVIRLVVENEPITISAVHIDSIPTEFYPGIEGLFQEAQIKVNGGERQSQFLEFREEMFPFELAAKQAHIKSFSKTGKSLKIDSVQFSEFLKAREIISFKEKEFCFKHADYYISGYLMAEYLKTPYALTSSEIDKIESMVRVSDSNCQEVLKEGLKFARKYQLGDYFIGFNVSNQSDEECLLSDYVNNPNKITVIDFWASWCGPCRAALKQLRQMYGKYIDTVNFISISTDEDNGEWLKALSQENLSWPQFRINQENLPLARKTYQIYSIPTFLIISSDGKILHYGHDVKVIDNILSKYSKGKNV